MKVFNRRQLEAIGRQFGRDMANQGITFQVMASKIGVTANTISTFVHGKNEISFGSFLGICCALGIDNPLEYIQKVVKLDMLEAKREVPSRNVEWLTVRQEISPEVEERENVFVHYRGGLPHAVIYWGSRDAVEAQQWLHSVAFARCAERGCGIRVAKLGSSCNNH